jgi:phosphosulfolactate synthase (CoM biosynthesis protein A)
MLEKIRQDGVIAFSELGHNKETNGNRELPAEIKLSLQKFVDAGYTKEEFFKVNAAELGNMSDYNLSEFEKKEN